MYGQCELLLCITRKLVPHLLRLQLSTLQAGKVGLRLGAGGSAWGQLSLAHLLIPGCAYCPSLFIEQSEDLEEMLENRGMRECYELSLASGVMLPTGHVGSSQVLELTPPTAPQQQAGPLALASQWDSLGTITFPASAMDGWQIRARRKGLEPPST